MNALFEAIFVQIFHFFGLLAMALAVCLIPIYAFGYMIGGEKKASAWAKAALKKILKPMKRIVVSFLKWIWSKIRPHLIRFLQYLKRRSWQFASYLWKGFWSQAKHFFHWSGNFLWRYLQKLLP
jgi:hypothetical protein